jgi:DNA integrity scanning protein DisA with diadenylate cyclase activity
VPADGVDLAFGLGTRHLAAASVSKKLRIIAVAVSESGCVRIYYDGEQLAEL